MNRTGHVAHMGGTKEPLENLLPEPIKTHAEPKFQITQFCYHRSGTVIIISIFTGSFIIQTG